MQLICKLHDSLVYETAAGFANKTHAASMHQWTHTFCKQDTCCKYAPVDTDLKLGPVTTLVVVSELVPGDCAVAILGQVNAQNIVIHVPQGKCSHCGKAHIEANNHPAHKGPGTD